jgi:methyl-accepting chemotaxis protein
MNSFVTMLISFTIVVLFMRSINKRSTKNYKNEIVSLGVLGTFVGIAMGLYHFDANDIKASMPHLLEGLKTAFITSGVGIFFSIIISVSKPQNQNKTEILGALENVVKDFNKNLTTQFGDNFKELNSAVKNMVVWQQNYKEQVEKNKEAIENVLYQLQKVEMLKKEEQQNIQNLISSLSDSGNKIHSTLQNTTDIVKEQLQLLLREANKSLKL